jgi:Plavaka transposase
VDGYDLNPGLLPPPLDDHADNNYSPFSNRTEFELMELLYVHAEMSAGRIDKLMNLLAALNAGQPPFASHHELYSLIDAIKQGEIPWNSFSIAYNGTIPQDGRPTPPWMVELHEIWFRDPLQVLEAQIGNPEFKNVMDFSPKRVYRKGTRQYEDLMSGNWAWDQAVCSHTSRRWGAEQQYS